MNSLVLKPWRCVVFLGGVIPGTTPWSGLRPTRVLAAGRRPPLRVPCAFRRCTPAEAFLCRRLVAAEPFLALWRIFPATTYACSSHAPTGVYLGIFPEKISSPRGALGRMSMWSLVYHIFCKNQSLTGVANGQFQAFS